MISTGGRVDFRGMGKNISSLYFFHNFLLVIVILNILHYSSHQKCSWCFSYDIHLQYISSYHCKSKYEEIFIFTLPIYLKTVLSTGIYSDSPGI